MLTEVQEKLMDEILKSNTEIAHDRATLNQMKAVQEDTVDDLNYKRGVDGDEFAQMITVILTPEIVNNFYFNFYTPKLFKGFESFDASDQMLNDREQTEVTDKLQELKQSIA